MRALKRSLSSGVMEDIFSKYRCFHSALPWWPFPPNPPNKILLSTKRPSACQKLMTGPLKIGGTNQFHKIMVMYPNRKTKKTHTTVHFTIVRPLFIKIIYMLG